MFKCNFLLIILICLSLGSGTDFYCQVSVIANKSVPVDQINSSKLFDMYSGDMKWWDNGEPVVVFDIDPNSEIKTAFYEFLGKSTSRMKSIWLKNLLSGEGDPPEAVKSEEEMLKKVISTRGAIGFVRTSEVNDKVKVLATIK